MHLYATEILLNHTLRSASGLPAKNGVLTWQIFRWACVKPMNITNIKRSYSCTVRTAQFLLHIYLYRNGVRHDRIAGIPA
ncbi:MAG: hypothetical protein KDE50_24200, partial [Caldilineaceae bacterium]|nr:hypothetical protein [Caldilineaceae bacterium]